MKRKWNATRSWPERPDAQRNWDCAYQYLLRQNSHLNATLPDSSSYQKSANFCLISLANPGK